MLQSQSELSPDRRARLARKGQILYGKSCGARGPGNCALSFALHQLRLGNVAVVRDLLHFLDTRLETLQNNDPEGLMPMTETLITQIRRDLEKKR